MNLFRKIILILLVMLPGIALDQITKVIAKAHLAATPGYSYFFDTIRLQFAENPGAFLGLGSKLGPVWSFILLMVLPSFILALLFIYLIIYRKINALNVFAFSLIIAGGSSNLYDRFVNNRYVVDFLNMGIGPVFRTGIFNLADFYVMAGVFLLLFFSGLSEKKAEMPRA